MSCGKDTGKYHYISQFWQKNLKSVNFGRNSLVFGQNQGVLTEKPEILFRKTAVAEAKCQTCDGTIFQDLVSRRAAHGQLSISAVFGNGSGEDELSIEIQNVVNASKPSESTGVIKHWSLRSRSNQIEATRESLHEKALYQITVSGVVQDSQQISWGGLLPSRSDRFPDWTNEKMDMIRGWASGVRYLALPVTK